MAIEIPENLIELGRSAEVERVRALSEPYSVETWRPWMDASAAFQAAVTAHAEAAAVSRFELEMAVKAAVRGPAEESS